MAEGQKVLNMNFLHSLKLVLFIGFGIVVLSGCGTMEGFGKDVQKLGGAIEKTAK